MNNELICIIDMFDSYSEVIYPDGNRERIPSAGALEYLYDTCKTEQIYSLHLIGDTKYLNGLIEQNSPLEYGCGKVEIKVN